MPSRIPQSTIDEVVSRASIAEVVAPYVKLQRRGTRLLGLCPFHKEKTPSFSVNESRGIYYCFGCQAGGNTVSFLMEHDGLSFPEAIRKLADQVGVVIPDTDEDPAEARRARDERARYENVMRFAARFYLDALWSGRYEAPLAYLREREIDERTAKRFGLGFAPAAWSTLLDAGVTKGIRPQWFSEAGLVVERQGDSGHYDRFRNRVMFPIFSLSKKVLAFSGRTLDPEDRAKYINSPETRYYRKGRELFGLAMAQKAIRKEGTAILVEGNFDVVSLHARGIENVCAPLGTAMTPDQARVIKRLADRVILLFDGDRAGRAAARKAFDVLLELDHPSVSLAELPSGSDPDDLVRRGGAEALREVLAMARPMLDVAIEESLGGAAGRGDVGARREAIESLAPLVARIQNNITRDSVIEEAARRLDMDKRALRDYLRSEVKRQRVEPSSGPEPESRDEAVEVVEERPLRYDRLENALIEILATDDRLLGRLGDEALYNLVKDPDLRDFLQEVSDEYVKGEITGFLDAVHTLRPCPLKSAILSALARDSGYVSERAAEGFDDIIRDLKLRWLNSERARLQEACTTVNEPALRRELATRISEILSMIGALKARVGVAS